MLEDSNSNIIHHFIYIYIDIDIDIDIYRYRYRYIAINKLQ